MAINCDTVDGYHASEIGAGTERWLGNVADQSRNVLNTTWYDVFSTTSTAWTPTVAKTLVTRTMAICKIDIAAATILLRIGLHNVTDNTWQYSKQSGGSVGVSAWIPANTMGTFSLTANKQYQLVLRQYQSSGNTQTISTSELHLSAREFST